MFLRLHPYIQKARLLHRSDLPELCVDVTIAKIRISSELGEIVRLSHEPLQSRDSQLDKS
jgi:hypothetical protein